MEIVRASNKTPVHQRERLSRVDKPKIKLTVGWVYSRKPNLILWITKTAVSHTMLEGVNVRLGFDIVASRIASIAEANLFTTATLYTKTLASTTNWKDLITYGTLCPVNL